MLHHVCARPRSRSSPPSKDLLTVQLAHSDLRAGWLAVPTIERYQRGRSASGEKASGIHHLVSTALRGRPTELSWDIEQEFTNLFKFGEVLVQIHHLEAGQQESDEENSIAPPVARSPTLNINENNLNISEDGGESEIPEHKPNVSVEQNLENKPASPPSLRLQPVLTPRGDFNETFTTTVEYHDCSGTPEASPISWHTDSLSNSAIIDSLTASFQSCDLTPSEDEEVFCSSPTSSNDGYNLGQSQTLSDGYAFTASDAGDQPRDTRQPSQGQTNTPNNLDQSTGNTPSRNPRGGRRDRGGNANGGNDRTARRGNRGNNRSRGRFPCVYHHPGGNDRWDECRTLKQYVSQLRRHHERHDFYYCSACFALFTTQDERNNHTACLIHRCVTENCPNYDKFPALLGNDAQPAQPCAHGKDSPLRDQWRYLFHLARPNDPVPEPEEPQQLPLPYFVPPSAAQASPNSFAETLQPTAAQEAENGGMASRSDSIAEREPAIAQLSAAVRSMTEMSERMEPHAGSFDDHTQRSIEWIRDHTRILSQQLQQVFDTVRSRGGRRGHRPRRPLPWTGQPEATITSPTPSSSHQGLDYMQLGFVPRPQSSLQRPFDEARNHTQTTTVTNYHSTPTGTFQHVNPPTNQPNHFDRYGELATINTQTPHSTQPPSGSDFSPMSDSNQGQTDEAK